jgi:hypothetical protein
MRKLILTGMAILIFIFFISCVSLPKLSGNEKFALVSFTLDKSIVSAGEEPDYGPTGLIVGDQDREAYFKIHRQALNVAWKEFKEAAPGIFGKARLVAINTIEGNAKLLAATRIETNIVMGKDISPGGTYLWPDKLNYIDLRNPSVVSTVAGIIDADIYIAVNYKAEYFISTGLAVGGVGGGEAKMRIIATITATDAAGKYFRTSTVIAESDETTEYVVSGIDSATYPRLIASAQKNLIPKMTSEIAVW